MICETLVQTFVLTAHPKTSAPPRPGSEIRNSDNPMTRARTSSLILGTIVALLRTAVERLWFTLMNRAWLITTKIKRKREAIFHSDSGRTANPPRSDLSPSRSAAAERMISLRDAPDQLDRAMCCGRGPPALQLKCRDARCGWCRAKIHCVVPGSVRKVSVHA